MQAVWPLSPINLPGSQLSHSAWRAFGLAVPGEHGVLAVEPVLQLEPAGQAVQSSALSSFGVLE